MLRQKNFKLINRKIYNKATINRGALTFWLDNEAIQVRYESVTPSCWVRYQHYSDLAITTVLVIKRVFLLTLCTAKGCIDSIFMLMDVPLRCQYCASVSKRTKSVNISFKALGYWLREYTDCNRAGANQYLSWCVMPTWMGGLQRLWLWGMY